MLNFIQQNKFFVKSKHAIFLGLWDPNQDPNILDFESRAIPMLTKKV
jgi:hypothetical protein